MGGKWQIKENLRAIIPPCFALRPCFRFAAAVWGTAQPNGQEKNGGAKCAEKSGVVVVTSLGMKSGVYTRMVIAGGVGGSVGNGLPKQVS